MIEAGFELELTHGFHSRDAIKKIVNAYFPGAVFRNIKPGKTDWAFYDDYSINPTRSHPNRVELITPVWKGEKKIQRNLKKLFMAFDQCDQIAVNNSCGLHVNVGFSTIGETKRIDPVVITTFFDWAGWLKYWGRYQNSYCRRVPITKRVLKNGLKKEDLDDLAKLSLIKNEAAGSIDKYSAINFEKLLDFNSQNDWSIQNKSKGFVEFRMAGGKTYLSDWNGMAEMLDQIFYVMGLNIEAGIEVATIKMLKRNMAA